jgi:thioredoxin 1
MTGGHRPPQTEGARNMSVLELTTENFAETIASGTTLVDFWAVWCGPCQMQGPIVEEFAEKQDAVKVAKVNVDEQPALAVQFGVMSIPTLAVFRDGQLVNKTVGLSSLEEIEELCK